MAKCSRVPRACATANAAGKSTGKPSVEWQQQPNSTAPVRREHHADANLPIRPTERPTADASAAVIPYHATATIRRLRAATSGPTTRLLPNGKYGRTAILLTVRGGFYVQYSKK